MIQNNFKDVKRIYKKELPYFVIENFFENSLYKNLSKTYPIYYVQEKLYRNENLKSASINFKNSEDVNFLKDFLSKNSNWRQVKNYFFSDEFKMNVREFINRLELPKANNKMKNFKLEDVETTINFTCSKTGFELAPHTDAKQKIIALVIYFADEDWLEKWEGGTKFFIPKSLRDAEKFIKRMSFNRFERLIPFNYLGLKNCHIRENYHNEFNKIFSKFIIEKFEKNKLVGFIKTNYTFHSVPKLCSPINRFRKSLLVNLNFKS